MGGWQLAKELGRAGDGGIAAGEVCPAALPSLVSAPPSAGVWQLL